MAMSEHEMESARAAIERGGPAVAAAHRTLAMVDHGEITATGRALADADKRLRLTAGPLADISKQIGMGLTAGPLADISKQMGMGLTAGPLVDISKQIGIGLTAGPLADISKQIGMGLTAGPFADISKQIGIGLTAGPLADISKQIGLGLTAGPLADISKQIGIGLTAGPLADISKQLNRPLIRWPLVTAIPTIQFSPESQQLWDDIYAAESFDPTITALSEQEMDIPIGVFVAELAVSSLAERIMRLGEAWSEPVLAVAAWQLEEEDARWRTADDDRIFSSIIHRAVSVLEEVARQIAHYHASDGQRSYIREASLRDALKVLTKRRVITMSGRERMTQAWNLRSKTPGAAHGVGGAPREAARFVLLRVRQGLSELLDAAEAGERLRD